MPESTMSEREKPGNGPENTANNENSRPESGEQPKKEVTFLEAKRQFDKLSRMADRTPEQEAQFKEAKGRMGEIINEVESEGLLQDVEDDLKNFEQRLEILKTMSKSGEFKHEHTLQFLGDIQNATSRAREITKGEEEGVYRGVREYVYVDGLKILKDETIKLSGGNHADQEESADTKGSASKQEGVPPEIPIPESVEEQRALVRALLERIEQNDQETYLIQNFTITSQIEAVLRKLHPEIQREVVARLRLQDCFVAVRTASLSGGDSHAGERKVSGGLYREKAGELNGKQRLLEGRDFYTLLVKGLPGLQISRAFMRLQEVAFKGMKLNSTDKALTKIFQAGVSEEKEREVYGRIIDELGGDEDARKSLQLALRIAWATLEVSVWNNDLIGVDPLAEAIYLRGYRQGKAQQGRDVGPRITIEEPSLEGFGTSYFRFTSTTGEEKSNLYNPSDLIIEKEDIQQKSAVKIREAKVGEKTNYLNLAVYKHLSRIRGQLNENTEPHLIPADKLPFHKLGTGDYGVWLSVFLPQILTVKDMFLKSTWKPEDMFPDAVERMLAPFKTLDEKGYLNLKYYLIAGAFHATLSDFGRIIALEWGWQNYKQAQDALTAVRGKNDEGKETRFLEPEKFAQIEKWLNIRVKMIAADAFRSGMKVR